MMHVPTTRLLPVRLAVGVAVALLVVLPALPGLTQPSGGQTLPSAEAWYQYLPTDGGDGEGTPDNPLCTTGLPLPGCPGDPTGGDPSGEQPAERPNPYPDNTLHVSLNAGADDTVTFLALDDPLRPPGDITGGTLTLPVAADAGNTAVEGAEFQACAISGEVTDGVEAGDPATAPEVDCTTSSPAVFTPPAEEPAEGPAGEPPAEGETADAGAFTVDLAPLAARWSTAPPALALVPTDAAREAGGTWHAAFSGRDRDAEGAEPITFTLTVAEQQEEEEDDDAPPSTQSPATTGGSTGGTTGGLGGSSGATSSSSTGATTARPSSPSTSGTASAPAITPPAAGDPLGSASQVAQDVQVAAPPAGAPTAGQPAAPVAQFTPSVGLVYPQAYFVPLLALALGTLVATSLVKPMRLPTPTSSDLSVGVPPGA